MMPNRLVIVLCLALLYIAVPFFFSSNLYLMSNVVASLIIGGIALSWALLGNLGGMVSFGHAAFVGVGAYTSALLVIKLKLSIFAALFLGGIGAAVASLLIVPALRLRGPYFALAILAYAHIFKIIANEWKGLTNGAAGLSSIPHFAPAFGIDFSSKVGAYFIVLSIVLVFAAIYYWIRQSHFGLALRAMHDSEEATRVVGVNSLFLKAMMLFLSAFMAGVMGAFNAHYINFLDPDYAFSTVWITLPIVAAIFGGYRTIIGPLLGAVAVYLIDQLVLKNIWPTAHQIVLGILLGAMILFSPGGLTPLVVNALKRRPHVKA
ncbi:MAG: branched-chain amino acid ABC transporter permease [Betaproteobacteria bacterium]|nr:branched-chain amino acid ABC transporter permease [Betaproteobacteria bacterium]